MILEECFRYIWVVSIQGIILGFVLAWVTILLIYLGIYLFKQKKVKVK